MPSSSCTYNRSPTKGLLEFQLFYQVACQRSEVFSFPSFYSSYVSIQILPFAKVYSGVGHKLIHEFKDYLGTLQ